MFDTNLLSQLRVLYVEDDDSIRESLASLFEKLFFEVIVAVDGKDGYEKFEKTTKNKKNIDIVISDITMPNISGIEMLKMIKKLDDNIPFILTTAYSDVHYFKEAINLNVTHYAIKPINIKEVTLHIQEICAVKFQAKVIKNKKEELEKYLMAIDQVALISKTDTKGFISYANEIFCDVSGYTKDELLGESHNIVRHPEVPSRTFEELWKTIKSGNIWKGRLKNLTKNKEVYHVNTTIIPIADEYEDKINEYISIRFLTTQEEEEKRTFKKQVIKNMGNIKKEFNEIEKENKLLKDKLKILAHMDIVQKQLENEKQRNKNFASQIKYYEKEILKVKKHSDRLILESKDRINHAIKEKNDYKFKHNLIFEKMIHLETTIQRQEEKILKQEIDLLNKAKKIKNLYEVVEFRENQLLKEGVKIDFYEDRSY